MSEGHETRQRVQCLSNTLGNTLTQWNAKNQGLQDVYVNELLQDTVQHFFRVHLNIHIWAPTSSATRFIRRFLALSSLDSHYPSFSRFTLVSLFAPTASQTTPPAAPGAIFNCSVSMADSVTPVSLPQSSPELRLPARQLSSRPSLGLS